jgi:hypothetical protein
MNKAILSLFAILFASICFAQSPAVKFPSYQKAVEEFFKQYVSPGKPGAQLFFEKRKEGWFALRKEYTLTADTISGKWQIWSSADNKFKQMGFSGQPDADQNYMELQQALRFNNQMFYFNLSPYYGYMGWEKDMINDFEGKKGLSDTILFSLAIAYSGYASGLLNDNTGYSDPAQRFKLEEKENCLSAKQLEEFRKYERRAIELMYDVKTMNPKFQTFVGSIANKADNEMMNSYLTLLYFQNEKEAAAEITKDLYNPVFIAMAKNFLNACEKNALLFTNGDNDTYPLLYVQHKFNFRKDVTVANLSLMQTSRYLNYLRRGAPGATGISFGLSEKDYASLQTDVIYIKGESDCSLAIENFSSVVNSPAYKMNYGGQELIVLPCTGFTIKAGKDSLRWKSNRQYIFRNDLAVLDAIAAAKFSRPVYFASTTDPSSKTDLQEFLRDEGLVEKMTTGTDSVNAQNEKAYRFFMNTFLLDGLDKEYGGTEKHFAENYYITGSRLALSLAKEGKKEEAIKLADKFLGKINSTVYARGSECAYFVEAYAKAGKKQKAIDLANEIIMITNLNCFDRTDPDFEMCDQQKAGLFNYFKGVADAYDLSEIKSKVQN